MTETKEKLTLDMVLNVCIYHYYEYMTMDARKDDAVSMQQLAFLAVMDDVPEHGALITYLDRGCGVGIAIVLSAPDADGKRTWLSSVKTYRDHGDPYCCDLDMEHARLLLEDYYDVSLVEVGVDDASYAITHTDAGRAADMIRWPEGGAEHD